MGRHILFIAAVHKRLTFLTMESAVFEFAIGLGAVAFATAPFVVCPAGTRSNG